MSFFCRTCKELAKALKIQAPTITIEGKLVKVVLVIKFTGPLAWAACVTSLTTAIALYLATPEAAVATAPSAGMGGVISFTGGMASTAVAASTLGSAAVPAVLIGVAAGGVGVLTSMRNDYKIVEKSSSRVVLQRK